MTSGTPQKRIVELSASTRRLLEAYAVAATAAGAGIMVFTSSAEAKIVYTAAHHVIKNGATYKLDLNHDGVVDFTFRDTASSDSDSAWWTLSASPTGKNGARGFRTLGGGPWASALKTGARIGGGRYFPGKILAFVVDTEGGDTVYEGSWANVKKRYLGFRFYINKKVHYGWARLNVVSTRSTITGTLTGYAYETVPNEPIAAGQTEGSDAPAIEPAGLGQLAKGAVGRRVSH